MKLPASAEVNSTITIAATAFDPDGNLKEMSIYYRFNNGALTLINENPIPVSGFYATAKVDWTPAQTGTYSIQARVEDHDGYRNDSSLGGAKYVVKSVEVVQAGTSQGRAGGQSGGTAGGQSGGATGQSGGSAPSFVSVRTSEKVYRNEFNSLWAGVLDSDGDLDEVQFQYRYKASGTTQWGEWEDLGSAVEVAGSRDTARSRWKPIDDRDYQIRAEVTDEAENSTIRESTRSFEMRQGSPLVLNFFKPDTIYSHEPNALSVYVKDATDNLDEVKFQSKGPSDTDWQDIGSAVEATSDHFFTAEVSWTPTQTGTHKIKVIVTDTSNNKGYYNSSSFTVKAAPRVVGIAIPTVYKNQANTISADVNDDDGDLDNVQFQYQGPTGTSWNNIGSAVSVSGSSDRASISWTPTRTGSHKIRVTVTDDTDKTHTRTTPSFEVEEPPTPPRVRSIRVPSRVYHNQANTLSARVTDINGDLDEALFEYDGPAPGTTWVDIGSDSVSGSSDTASISWTPTLLGTYIIKVTATDEDSNTGNRRSNSFTVECSPVLSN